MRAPLWLALLASTSLAGCNPYMAAVGVAAQTYAVATDDRSLSTQASDAEIVAQIKASLIESPVQGTGSLNVFCTRGVVVLAGVVPAGSPAGPAAAEIARATPGVSRVETFFVTAQPSLVNDLEIKEEIKAAFVADPSVEESQVDIGVYAGHVVLVGLVGSVETAEQFVADARSVEGVASVRSYIQLTNA
jgi:hyperosmotically inducible protein